MKEKKKYPIDFVIIWVDGNDPEWRKEYNKYKGITDGDQSDTRFRDMDLLQYWFRGVEKYTPWVNKIYFVTCGQRPEWLNVNNPKLVCVDHKDFIPEKYLPTFSSHCIELNLHRIKGLSKRFVYFNDDTFIIKKISEDYFFKNGLPCDSAVINYPVPKEEPINYVPVTNTAIINRNFTKYSVMKKNFNKFYTPVYGKFLIKNLQFSVGKWFPGFKYFHQPSSFLRSTFADVWKAEPEKLEDTCSHRFRVLTDVNQWLLQDWQICQGKFMPRDPSLGYYGTLDSEEELKKAVDAFNSNKYSLFCANDAGMDFEKMRSELTKAFGSRLPDKCSFEV